MLERILAELDNEISHLQQVRSLLTQNGAKNPAAKLTKKGKWKMSAAARKRIGDAQRKRWAKQKAGK
jgi:hypothetical protein